MNRVEPNEALTDQIKSTLNNNNNNILDEESGREVTRNGRNKSASRISRISITDNGSLVDYGVDSPAPPPAPQPPTTPLTHFGRNASGRSSTFARDTSRLVNDSGSRYPWMEFPNGINSGGSNGVTSRQTNSARSAGSAGARSAGGQSAETIAGSVPVTPTKTNGSVYGMYRNLSADENQILDGLRSRNGPPKPILVDHGHRKHDDDKMSGGALCCLTLLVIVAQILLHGLVGLVLYWVIRFHTSDGASFPFAWRENPTMEFNLHPVLMIVGFIYCSGQAMLFYRSCRCCRRIWNKLFHTMFHLLAIPCIAIGFIAVLDSHNLRLDPDGKPSPIPNFYSLHSWMGLTTMGLFALQFFVGFFSFLLLLCCESATASFRASLVPVHAAFGLTTFVLAVATACTGFTEKAFFTLSTKGELTSTLTGKPVQAVEVIGNEYFEFSTEGIIINTMGCAMVGLAIILPCILKFDPFRKGIPLEGGGSVYEDDI